MRESLNVKLFKRNSFRLQTTERFVYGAIRPFVKLLEQNRTENCRLGIRIIIITDATSTTWFCFDRRLFACC